MCHSKNFHLIKFIWLAGFLFSHQGVARVVNQLSSDIMTWKVEVIGTFGNDPTAGLSAKNCKNDSQHVDYDWLDCREAFEQKYNMPVFHAIYAKRNSNISCRIIKLTTLTKVAPLQNSAGIGFSHGRPGRGYNVKFFDQAALSSKFKRRIMHIGGGIKALAYDFVGLSNCHLDAAKATYKFRVFLRYDTASGTTYRNWDRSGFLKLPYEDSVFERYGAFQSESYDYNSDKTDENDKKDSEGLLFEERDRSYIIPN